ncbi:hypothetical protein QFC22_001470 [Naganishia vaughanmartiniae]|uniref:Uncharacterized protein n=1 Tax=Naganishia vaughanmartiniae TaxID=1424756 RepID=A0ACC2XKN5_9TREE|nr:hypothetical protein QFC22_001470 [Naganishia vaughanmartiniae]
MPFKPILDNIRHFSFYTSDSGSGTHEEQQPVNKLQQGNASLSPTLSYYAHFIPPTPTPAPRLPNTSHAAILQDLPVRRSSSRLKQKPNLKPIDMSRIKRAQSKKIPRVVVTCGLDGQPDEDDDSEARRRTVEVGRVEVESVDVKSARASVGDMRLASSQATKVSGSSEAKNKVDAAPKALSTSPSIVEIEPGHRFPSWMGGTDYHHLLVDNNTTSQSHSTSRTSSPLPRARATRISPLASSTASLSPESGGPLHQILLTPITSDDHSRSTDDLFAHKKQRKRRTLTDIAVGLLADQRLRWMKHRPHGHSRGDSFNDLPTRPKSSGLRNVREAVPSTQVYSSSRSPRSNGNTADKKVESSSHVYSQGHRGYELSDMKREWRMGGEKRTLSREEAQSKAKRNKWAIAIALILLVVCSTIVGVCVSLLRNRDSTSQTAESSKEVTTTLSLAEGASRTTSSSAAAASTSSVTYNLDTCLELFTLSAASSPSTYPCSQCLSPLSSVINDFAPNVTSDKKSIPGVGSALQFCALQAIYKTTEGVNSGNVTASSVLSGWMKDTGVCTGWTGVECDSQGRIIALSLVYPNVPKSIDSTLKHLVALQSLKIVGNSIVPSGSIPESALSSTLKTIDIESTALTSFTAKTFAGSIGWLQTLLLISNAKLGNSLPDLSSATSLQTL